MSAFHDPYHWGDLDITPLQVNQTMTFQFDQAVMLNATVSITELNKRLVKKYTVGDGLTLSNADQTITLQLQGADFVECEGKKLIANCSFFKTGDVESYFTLEIVRVQA